MKRDFKKLAIHNYWEARCKVTELFDEKNIKYRRFVATIFDKQGIVVYEGYVDAMVMARILVTLQMIKHLIKIDNKDIFELINTKKVVDFYKLQEIYYEQLKFKKDEQ